MDPWKGICYDDGTGRNVYFVDETGERQRKVPDNYVPEVFSNGMRKYYYRGTCLRCRLSCPAVFLTMRKKSIGYSLNICEHCILTTYSDDSRILKGDSDKIWELNIDTPKHFYSNLEDCAFNRKRDKLLIRRSREAKLYVNAAAKLRRNMERESIIKLKASQCKISEGKHLSWGFDNTNFDEYFGKVDEATNQIPSGEGVRFYADGSVYIGEWLNGLRHTTKSTGVWTRPDGMTYEGSWFHGQKHGKGTQKYPNGSVYQGEFAKHYEHGHGVIYTPDGSRFEGKFRFGKKDGPGVFTLSTGEVIKKVFREGDVYHEKPLTNVSEETDVDGIYFEPLSLLQICIGSLANTMHTKRTLVSSSKLHNRLPDYMKTWISNQFLDTMTPQGSKELKTNATLIAFKSVEVVSLKAIKFINFDCDSLLYFISGNKSLKTLELTINGLDLTSLDLICKRLSQCTWTNLNTLNLSFNRLDMIIVESLMISLSNNKNLRILKLSGCNINQASIKYVTNYLQEEHCLLTELDLSFNSIGTSGAEHIAEAIKNNDTLLFLNLRKNGLGSIGGDNIAESMIYNNTLKELCLVDNKISADVMTLIIGRLTSATTRNIINSVKANELITPIRHNEYKRRIANH